MVIWYHITETSSSEHFEELRTFLNLKKDNMLGTGDKRLIEKDEEEEEEEEEEKKLDKLELDSLLGCDLQDKLIQVHVCRINTVIMSSMSKGTSFEGYHPVMRGINNVEHFPRPLSDMIRFLLLDKYGGLYMDADAVLIRDLTPLFTSSPNLDCFSSFWGVQGFMNTGAILRLKHKSEHASLLIQGLVKAAKRGEEGVSGGGGGGGGGGLLINTFHPKSVTKIAKKLGLFPYHFKPLSLAFFEPAWCQPVTYI
jgi:hypothetical protein